MLTRAPDALMLPVSSAAPVTSDDELEALGQTINGFAGFYIDDAGVLVIQRAAGGRSTALEAAVRGFAKAHGGELPVKVRIHDVDVTFGELRRLRRALQPFAIPGVIMVDVDEVRNRLVLGVATTADSLSVDAVLKRSAENTTFVVIRHVARIIPMTATLRDTGITPAVGGIQIAGLGAAGLCTAGPIVRYPGFSTKYILTNSHCTQAAFQNDGGAFHQPFVWNPWNTFRGYEVSDPPHQYGAPWCDAGTYCRQADAALYQPSNQSWPVFEIARTTDMVTTPGVMGSIDRAFPNFIPTGLVPYSNLVVGQGLHKVGRTSGWSTGTISNTCVDGMGIDGVTKIRCSFVMHASVAGGDSGSPVFQWVGGASGYDVYVAGILWGMWSGLGYLPDGNPYGDYLLFSPWQQIGYDLAPSITPYP
jgi:hypothetical protein